MKSGRWIFALALICACEVRQGSGREATPATSNTRGESVTLPNDPPGLAVALGVPVDSLRAAGEERYWRDAFDSAQAIWRVEVRRALAARDKQAEARAHMWLGLAAYKLDDYPTARREGEISLQMKRQVGLDTELSRSFNALGLLAWQEGRYQDALGSFDSAIASARRHNDSAGIARASLNIPLVQTELGDYDNARRGLIAAQSLGRGLHDDRMEGNALANLGMLEIRLGRATSALGLLAEARKHYHAIEYAPGEANALGQFATAWGQLGDLQKALAAADTALSIARREGLPQEAAAELEVLADLHAQAGNPRLALMRLQEADSIDASVGLTTERGTNLRRISSILADLGEAPASVARARAALAAHQRVDAAAETIYDRIQLSRSLSLAGDSRAATAEVDSAASAALKTGNPSAIRDAALTKAQLTLAASNPEAALKALRQTGTTPLSNSWQIDDLRAQSLLALGRLDEARVVGEHAVALVERERGSLGVGPLRAGYLQSRTAPFSNLIAIHLARGDTTSGFKVAASLAGRTLIERMGAMPETGSSLSSTAEGERILLKVGVLEQEISELGGSAKDEKRRAPLNQAVESARASYEEYLARSARLGKTPTVGADAITLAFAQSRLADNEALAVFASGPERLNVFVVRRQRTIEYSAPISDRALALRVRVARDVLGRERRSSGAPPVMTELYDLLLAPAANAGMLQGVTRLLVIPHGSLGSLPFGALWDRRAGKFLIEESAIRYLPSAATLTSGNDEPPTVASGTIVFAPIPDSLPGTRLEAEAIGRTIPSTLRIGKASTETGVRSALQLNRPIHIASHGLHNSKNPLFSRMTVAESRSTTGSNDGRLEVHEILGLTTRSPLVFLSGCETGLVSGAEGPMARGSDESSLAQAFLIAGAKNVVATLWRVDDKEAVQIASLFYRYLQQGHEADEALALAQRESLHLQRDYTWAAYAISGTGAPARKSAAIVRTTVTDR